ncbi:LOW QUALITY PROTEIN: DNA repair protein RAD51 homolog 3-like [Diprion similis]|uniref:LOW QUALITY PROTEIN: DNA repair protein RAD51 homolog 3-like n=1 Tax=Diprion similis TaxID=362088 RepID=UPI001EF932C4|nr:LOW QUALITY PROTEIN: DNA repair protein RAD51 homolog 3-like [Diprion similis]
MNIIVNGSKSLNMMLRPISSLALTDTVTSQLKNHGFCYVNDILSESVLQSVSASEATCIDAIQAARLCCKVPKSFSALDILEEELLQAKITTLSQTLDNILDGGFQCRTVTELCGAPGSGKTQICMQISINVQMSESHSGLGGQTLYIDTRSGLCIARLKEMAMASRVCFGDRNFDIDRILKHIIVTQPQSIDELSTVLGNFNELDKNCQIRLIIVDSLSFRRYSIENTFHRTQKCFRILDKLNKLATRFNLAVVVTNELVTSFIANDDLVPASGLLCAHRVHKRFMLTRLDDNKFSACAMKTPTMPEVSSKFQVTAGGIRDIM